MKKIIAIISFVLLLGTFAVPSWAQTCHYSKGQKVEVKWKGRWYPSTILKVKVKDGKCRYKIHYDGWSSSWDETVVPRRIRSN